MSLVTLGRSPLDVIDRTLTNWLWDADRLLPSGFKRSRLSQADVYIPNVDIFEDKESFFIIAELPGMEEKDVKLTIDDGTLTIQGRKERKEERNEYNYHHIERSFGEFARTLSLPTNIDESEVRAHFTNGLLEVELPKKQSMRSTARQIPVKGAKPVG